MLSHLKVGTMLWKMKVNDRAEKRLATLTLLTFKENLVSPLSTATQMRCLRNLGKRDSKEHESEMQYFGQMMGWHILHLFKSMPCKHTEMLYLCKAPQHTHWKCKILHQTWESVDKTLIESAKPGERQRAKRGKRGSVKKDALALDHQNMYPDSTPQSKRR